MGAPGAAPRGRARDGGEPRSAGRLGHSGSRRHRVRAAPVRCERGGGGGRRGRVPVRRQAVRLGWRSRTGHARSEPGPDRPHGPGLVRGPGAVELRLHRSGALGLVQGDRPGPHHRAHHAGDLRSAGIRAHEVPEVAGVGCPAARRHHVLRPDRLRPDARRDLSRQRQDGRGAAVGRADPGQQHQRPLGALPGRVPPARRRHAGGLVLGRPRLVPQDLGPAQPAAGLEHEQPHQLHQRQRHLRTDASAVPAGGRTGHRRRHGEQRLVVPAGLPQLDQQPVRAGAGRAQGCAVLR